MINGNVTWHLKGGWMMLTNLILFLVGVIVGSVGIILWTCLVVASDADDRRITDFKEWQKENEENN